MRERLCNSSKSVGIIIAFSLPFSFILNGCTSRNSELTTYMTQNLDPGVGLGDIKLIETSLEDAVTQFGQPQFATFTLGEESNQIILSYFPEEIHLQFTAPTKLFAPTNSACATTISGLGAAGVNELRNMVSFLKKHSECKPIYLTSITLSAEERGNDTYYVGKTGRGVSILDSVEVIVSKYGAPDDVRGLDVVSPSPFDTRYDNGIILTYKEGIAFFLDNEKLARRIAIFPADWTPPQDVSGTPETDDEVEDKTRDFEEAVPEDIEQERSAPQPGF